MNKSGAILGSMALCLLLAGCSGSSASRLLGGDSPSTQPQAQAAADLSMPPDMQLRPPGSAPPPAAPEPSTEIASAAPDAYTPPPAAAAPQGDVYERNGISKVRPDGTPKSDAELKAELKQVYLAKKQASNPNYGSVFNIGNIFKDE